MYKDSRQLRIEDYVFPYGKLDPENDWVKLAALVPWETAEERYAVQFADNGHPAHPCRMALGALLIQRRLKCSDVWLVKHIGENSYLHYFIKTWQIFLPTFRFGSNKFSNTISFLQHLIQNKILFHLEQQLTASSDAIRRLML